MSSNSDICLYKQQDLHKRHIKPPYHCITWFIRRYVRTLVLVEFGLWWLSTTGSRLFVVPLAAANRQVLLPGDIILGGLFPIHEAGRNATMQCGRIKADQGVQRMVAMLFALEHINSNSKLLPGIQLGAQILDTCSVETHALEQSLEFIKTAMSTSDRLSCADGSRSSAFQRQQPVAAVIPMLSYSSTGVELSEKPRSLNLNGHTFTQSLIPVVMVNAEWIAIELGICIDGDVHKVTRRWTDDQFEELISRMRHTNKARGVVMFVDEDNLRRFLTNLKRMIWSGSYPELRNYFWFVASDSWGMKTSVIKGFEQIVNGAITIAPKVRFLKDFNEYFGQLGPVNTFLSEYWQSMNCTNRINENFERCFDSINYKFKQEAYVPFVFDGVNLVAQALHSYIKAYCGDDGFTNWKDCHISHVGFEGYRLQQFYRNVSVTPDQPPLIDANGDGIGQYSIFQLDNQGVYTTVGRWLATSEEPLELQKVDGNTAVPLSVCSTSCERGYYRAYQDQTCCWTCIPCDITTSIIVNETSCIQCNLGMVPNVNLDSCRPIKALHLEWSSAWALVPSVFALCGLTATIFVVSVFLRYNDTPVVMASGRELCYCMLFGISLCYLVTFVLVNRPSAIICALSRVLIGLSMAAVYAAILVKTNRLARVFTPSSAVGICTAIVSVQLVGSLVWLVVDPPDTAIQYPTRTEAVLTCKATASHLLVSLVFNMLLILACTIYAFKTRKIPENFNETRLIGFTMYSTSILWLAFGPIYFATQNNFKIQITSLCMCISMSGTVALACFFAPKVYIVLWQPYKNVRTRNSAVGKLVNQQMRFISQLTAPQNSAATVIQRSTAVTTGVTMITEISTTNGTGVSVFDGFSSISHPPSSPETIGTAHSTPQLVHSQQQKAQLQHRTAANTSSICKQEQTKSPYHQSDLIPRPHSPTHRQVGQGNAEGAVPADIFAINQPASSAQSESNSESLSGEQNHARDNNHRGSSGYIENTNPIAKFHSSMKNGDVVKCSAGRENTSTISTLQGPCKDGANPIQLILREIKRQHIQHLEYGYCRYLR
ncbi:7 transmembrane sweet-taste receptor of 3 GCPR domain-containing protein [Ditylenchus destructor]|nr:7 transmembrane sweet-taste receptor of 3 GCPR domain-containing protein [Ditylenchus destructor]